MEEGSSRTGTIFIWARRPDWAGGMRTSKSIGSFVSKRDVEVVVEVVVEVGDDDDDGAKAEAGVARHARVAMRFNTFIILSFWSNG